MYIVSLYNNKIVISKSWSPNSTIDYNQSDYSIRSAFNQYCRDQGIRLNNQLEINKITDDLYIISKVNRPSINQTWSGLLNRANQYAGYRRWRYDKDTGNIYERINGTYLYRISSDKICKAEFIERYL